MKRSVFLKVFAGYVVLLFSLAGLFLAFSYGTVKNITWRRWSATRAPGTLPRV